MIELWVAEIFDYTYEVPYLVGIFATEQQALDAVGIVIARVAEKENEEPDDLEERFVPNVVPVQLNTFAPACMDWLGYE